MRSEKNGKSILLVEDEAEVRSYLEMSLRCEGYAVEATGDGEDALVCLRNAFPPISAVLLDIIMPRQDGMETLREIRNTHPDLPVIMISGASSPLNVVEAMRRGATNFLGKPVNYEELRKVVKLALEPKTAARPEIAEKSSSQPPSEIVYISSNRKMQELQNLVGRIGWSEAPVLIQGETGVGKEVFARQLHARSPRANKPFLKLNCAALPSELVESELFGYERGAFTGAMQKKPGIFEQADGGTILLDEIGDMDYKLQAKLLHVLQDREFQRLGGKDVIRVDVRIMAATHCDLETAMATRAFREDLYYRLSVINLHLPPLRECREDVVPLLEYLLRKYSSPQAPIPFLTPHVRQSLALYDWPGNVRELENFARKLLVLKDPEKLLNELLAAPSRRAAASEILAKPVAETVPIRAPILEQVTKAKEQAETEAILAALHSTRWNRKQAAAVLKIDYKALLYKMKKLGIEDKVATFSSSAQHANVAGA
jgi:two-component system response regulator AtoC